MKRPTFTPDRLDVRASERHTWPGEAHSGPIDTDDPQLTTWPGRWLSTMLESGAIQARGGTLPGRMLGAFAVESRRRACTREVSVYKLAHIRAVHTINETGHGYGLSLGAGFQFFHFRDGRRPSAAPAARRCVATSDMSYSMIG